MVNPLCTISRTLSSFRECLLFSRGERKKYKPAKSFVKMKTNGFGHKKKGKANGTTALLGEP